MDRFLEPWGMHEGTLVFSFSMVPDKEEDKCEKASSQESDSIWIRVIMGLDIAQSKPESVFFVLDYLRICLYIYRIFVSNIYL